MDNIPIYIIVNLKINNPDEYKIYEKGFFPFLKKYNGSFITFDDSPECLEGDTPKQFDRVILFSFPSEKDADNWWNDDGYQELSMHRRAATEITLQKVKGMPPR
ncbi:MAG: hypothetical protein NT02SARS_1554 [SAR86 cluster bacterium SAR86B]|uniref:DUF1330 domain-containing protein n=1 Tax=SAR86 cluster bacterium SAR86B TaxID=1123867 RepID=J4X0L6_9GAMM|nr:MAG: hypothetical protein NT02SARS_1554 [SAR86 cluster bacterium SAR86B]